MEEHEQITPGGTDQHTHVCRASRGVRVSNAMAHSMPHEHTRKHAQTISEFLSVRLVHLYSRQGCDLVD